MWLAMVPLLETRVTLERSAALVRRDSPDRPEAPSLKAPLEPMDLTEPMV